MVHLPAEMPYARDTSGYGLAFVGRLEVLIYKTMGRMGL